MSRSNPDPNSNRRSTTQSNRLQEPRKPCLTAGLFLGGARHGAEHYDGAIRLGWWPNDDFEVRKARLLKHRIEAAALTLTTRRMLGGPLMGRTGCFPRGVGCSTGKSPGLEPFRIRVSVRSSASPHCRIARTVGDESSHFSKLSKAKHEARRHPDRAAGRRSPRPRRRRVHPGLFLLARVYASPRRPQKVVFCVQGALSEAAVCIVTYIETKAAPGTSTLWAKATTRGPLTW
jgi:hypothetical protein